VNLKWYVSVAASRTLRYAFSASTNASQEARWASFVLCVHGIVAQRARLSVASSSVAVYRQQHTQLLDNDAAAAAAAAVALSRCQQC